jgi:hypothetical protein
VTIDAHLLPRPTLVAFRPFPETPTQPNLTQPNIQPNPNDRQTSFASRLLTHFPARRQAVSELTREKHRSISTPSTGLRFSGRQQRSSLTAALDEARPSPSGAQPLHVPHVPPSLSIMASLCSPASAAPLPRSSFRMHTAARRHSRGRPLSLFRCDDPRGLT